MRVPTLSAQCRDIAGPKPEEGTDLAKPRTRHEATTVLAADLVPQAQATRVPWEQRASRLVDPKDPAVRFICAALFDLRAFGYDIHDPDVIKRAINKGRRDHARKEAPRENTNRLLREMESEDVTPGSVVYYMRIGNRVKIGFSTNIVTRLATINPEELLATEAGGYVLEQQRHRQFMDLRTHGEWFSYEDLLVDHIVKLRQGDLTGA